ncbi:MAG TPA: hypothetical protein DCZ03_12465 [Gammaproteobacteria bacterium]|nr:hypothetical protein [Gammaproteobacteria bacterium]
MKIRRRIKIFLFSAIVVMGGCNHDSDDNGVGIGEPSINNSSITASPTTLAADGFSQTAVTVFLADNNQNFMVDGTEVTLQTTAGTVSGNNPTTTIAGRASFTLVAPTAESTAQLTVAEVSGLTGSVVFNATDSTVTGDPANIELSVTDSHLFVAGVGKKSNTTLTITVLDGGGNPIGESSYGDSSLNNIRVELLSQPNGGEYLSGRNAAGSVVTTKTADSIEIRTQEGVATVNVQSGSVPGVLEVRVTALLDALGSTLAASELIVAAVPQVVIASGPPHAIAFTHPIEDAIVDDDQFGVYRLRGAVVVSDRYGNAVPDGTVVSLGVMDSIIAMGNDGVIADGSVTLTGSGYGTEFQFDDTITRNGVARGIETNDRVLILNADAANKSRFVSSVASSVTADTVSEYGENKTGLIYAVGASTLGAVIGGENEEEEETIGRSTTVNGIAKLWLTYPANTGSIYTGCGSYGVTSPVVDLTTYDPFDTRYQKEESAQVILVASAAEGDAISIDANQFCFAAVAPLTLEVSPVNISGDATISFIVLDDNDILLPFNAVNVSVNITNRGGGSTFDISVPAIVATNQEGFGSTLIDVVGTTVSGDSATVSFILGDESVDVKVVIP